MFAIGLDIGTTSVCGILHNATTGEIIKSITLDNDSFIETENSWEKIQSADRLIEILYSVLNALMAEGKKVISIGLSGQMHGIVYLNQGGNAVSSLKIWQDGRGDLTFIDGLTYAEYMSKQSGYPLSTGYGSVTYFYDFKNGLVPKDAVTFCTIHDYAAMKLTGNKKPLVHPSNAASFGLFNLKDRKFDKNAIEKLGLNYDMFPSVCLDYSLIGEYNGIPVAVALGDNQASFLGSVADIKNSLLINVGTGSQISCPVANIPDNSSIDCRPLIEDSYILAGSSLCGGRAYAVLEKLFREIAVKVTGKEIKSAYHAMDILTDGIDTVKNPLKINTLFSGSRANSNQRGSIENICTDNFNMLSLCDGVMYGIVNELYEFYCEIKNNSSVDKKIMVASGNGIRANKALKKRFELVFGMPIKTPIHKEEAAFGASLYALVASKVYKNINDAQKLIKYI